MITKNSKVLLTIQLEGRLGTTVSNTSSREVKNKIMLSPFETISDKGKLITPKNHFKSNDSFNVFSILVRSLILTLSYLVATIVTFKL